MRKFLIAAPLALAAATVLANPASAAPQTYSSAQIIRDINQLDRQIDQAQSRRTISPREASQLHRQVRQIQTLRAQYARGGFTRAELRTLDSRITSVKQQLRVSHNDRNHSPYRR